ncbi:WalW protein [Glaciecola sp. 1036]|uniref:WalW protein n=1 Tax=Alteromonadaceae TaxID=72275 RepID=UPI003D000433
MVKPELVFLLSIDTEEEWDWNGPFPEDQFDTENTQQLPRFQQFCESISVKPTYLVDYAAAKAIPSNGEFVQSVLSNKAEIGAHLHPWANPPFFGKPDEFTSHVINLPLHQVEEKLDLLIELLTTKFHSHPKSFRTGRWGISGDIMKLLFKKGFEIDSSVYPFYENEYFSCQGAPVKPYWPSFDDVLGAGVQRNLLEIPVSVGFNRASFGIANSVYNTLDTPAMQKLKANAIMWHTGLLKKIYMSPEVTDLNNLKLLCDSIIHNGCPIIHMYFHSSSLISDVTGVLKADDPFQVITSRIQGVVEHLSKTHDVKCLTLSEAKTHCSINEEYMAA